MLEIVICYFNNTFYIFPIILKAYLRSHNPLTSGRARVLRLYIAAHIQLKEDIRNVRKRWPEIPGIYRHPPMKVHCMDYSERSEPTPDNHRRMTLVRTIWYAQLLQSLSKISMYIVFIKHPVLEETSRCISLSIDSAVFQVDGVQPLQFKGSNETGLSADTS